MELGQFAWVGFCEGEAGSGGRGGSQPGCLAVAAGQGIDVPLGC